MAISPTDANDVFIREVDDAVREDQLKGFWDRYGKAVLGGIFVALIGYGGYLFYSHQQSQTADANGEAFVQAFEKAETGTGAAALKDLSVVEKTGTPVYQAAAQMVQAGVALNANDTAKATALYGQVATNTKIPQEIRDLATIRMLTTNFDNEKPETIIARIKPIAVESNPAFASAGELLGITYMKMNREADAAAIFRKVADSKATPDSLKQRAQQMASMLASSTNAPAAKEVNEKTTNSGGEQKK